MASPAIDGFHSIVCYYWEYDDYECGGETTPIIYASRAGKYTCKVFSKDIEMKSTFTVWSK